MNQGDKIWFKHPKTGIATEGIINDVSKYKMDGYQCVDMIISYDAIKKNGEMGKTHIAYKRKCKIPKDCEYDVLNIFCGDDILDII